MKKPPIKFNKKSIRNAKVVFYSISLLVFAVLLLIIISYYVSLAQRRILVSANSSDKDTFLTKNVSAEIKKEPVIEIVDTGTPPPPLSAQAVLIQDVRSGEILYQKNMKEKMGPASTTKLMTALVALEHFQSADILEVYPQALVGGSSMGLTASEKLTFRGLLYGMLLNSGNDAAYTIASNYPGGLEVFVEKMNQKAKDMGLENTYFQNPAGFDGVNHYSSAYDLAKIASFAASNPQLAHIFKTKETSVSSVNNDKVHSLKNLNKLLEQPDILGIKTGYTQKSGENLVSLVQRNNIKILTVVLNSNDRFGETRSLMDWVYSNFVWKIEYK